VNQNWDQQTRRTDLSTAVDSPLLRAVWSGGSASLPLEVGVTYAVGRGEDCQLRIASDTVSRRHAEVRLTSLGELEVKDLGSANGTKVAGGQLKATMVGRATAGQLIEVGSVLMTFQKEPESLSVAESDDSPMRRLLLRVDMVAKSHLAILILGESGVGKEVLAARIHAQSPRSSAPFVKVNCAALVDNLLEAELFGYERGAFTGATQSKAGLIESADGGTFLLDEVGEMPLPIQAKLLRVIETGELTRVGALRPKRIDVRFVSSTNRVLTDEVRAGRFREDLYHRLDGFAFTVLPLRQRREEIAKLAQQFIRETCAQLNRVPPTITSDALDQLRSARWPGNIRQLRNVIARSVVLCEGAQLTADYLQFGPEDAHASDMSKEGDRRANILSALAQAGGNQKKAALALGVSVRTLQYRMDELAIQRPRK
jgi:two-component system, NtrC family, response regulator AtoC